MERTRLLTFAVVGLLVLNLAVIVFLWIRPDRPPGSERRGGPPPVEGPARLIIERLHFDKEQQRQYLQLVAKHQQQTKALNAQSAHLYTDYYGLLKTAHPDTTRASTLSQQIADLQQAITQINFAHFNEIKAICRPDQQAAFNQLVDDLSNLFGHLVRPGGHPPERSPENFSPRP